MSEGAENGTIGMSIFAAKLSVVMCWWAVISSCVGVPMVAVTWPPSK
jgi:hypothetical protein